MRIAEFNSVDLTQGPLHLAGWWHPAATPPCKIDLLPAYAGKITDPVWGQLRSPSGEDTFQLWYDGGFWDQSHVEPASREPLAFMREQWTRNTLKAKGSDTGSEIVLFDEMEHGLQALSGDLERYDSGNGGEFETFRWNGQDSFRVYLAVSFPTDFAAAKAADTPIPMPDEDGVFRYLTEIGGRKQYSMQAMRRAAFSFLWLCVEHDGEQRCVVDWPF